VQFLKAVTASLVAGAILGLVAFDLALIRLLDLPVCGYLNIVTKYEVGRYAKVGKVSKIKNDWIVIEAVTVLENSRPIFIDIDAGRVTKAIVEKFYGNRLSASLCSSADHVRVGASVYVSQ